MAFRAPSTGTLSVPRAAFEAYITENGGSVAKTVTKACTHLVSSETGTKKCEDAEAKGVAIVDEQWVRNKVGSDPVAAAAAPAKKAAKGKKAAAEEEEEAEAPAKKAPAKKAAAKTKPAEEEPAPKKAAGKKAAAGGGSGGLAGMTICITGTLSQPRAEFEALLTQHGAKIAKTVTNTCTHLVSAETGTKKCQDAEAKGVTIVNEDWVRSKIDG